MFVVFDRLLDKLKSNLKKIQSCFGGRHAFGGFTLEILECEGVHFLNLPERYGEIIPVLHAASLRFRSYDAAMLRGIDVGKRRNLAKSVSVV